MPTADFCCGAECGIVTAGTGVTPNARHWGSVSSAGVVTSQTAIARNGGRAYRFVSTAGEAQFQRDLTGTTRWFRWYEYFPSLPDGDCFFFQAVTASGTQFPQIRYRTATTDMIIAIGNTVTGATAVPIVTGQFYLIELEVNVDDGGNRYIGWTVNGVDKGSISTALAATTLTAWRIGIPASTVTADVVIDDIITGPTLADYPVGAGQSVALFPNADGTHSFNTVGDFVYGAAGGNIATDATDTHTYIDHTLEAIGDFLNAAACATGEYLEWGFADMPAVTSINGLEVVSAHHAAATGANLQSLRMIDGATPLDIFSDVDFSNTSLAHHSHHIAVAPSSSAAWTKAKIDAMLMRWGSSFTAADVTPDAFLDGLLLEVDYVPSTASTRFYLTDDIAAAVAPAVDAAWERSIASFDRTRLTLTKDEDHTVTVSSLFGSTSTSQTCWHQFISAPLDGNQTIDQPVSLVMRCQENSLAENAHLAFVLWVMKPDLTARGTLKTQHATSTEFPTSGATRIHSALATSSVAALSGDRLVLEVGVHGVTPANVDNIILEWGADGDVADHALAEGSASSLAAWMEIAQALTFAPEPHTATGDLNATINAVMAGTATLKYVGTGALSTSLGATMVGDATLTYVATGALSTRIAATMTGSATGALVVGTGNLIATLTVSMSGTATYTDPTEEEIVEAGRARGGHRRIIYEVAEEKEPKPQPKPKPVPKAAPLAELPASLPSLIGSSFDPELWHRMAQFRVNAPAFADPTPEPTPEAPGDRLMRQLTQDSPAFTMIDDGDQFLEHFLRMLGMELE